MLVADFSSDEVYDLVDEEGLAMRQALRESRRRVKSLCEGRKLADSTELLTTDLVRELQSFLTRYWSSCREILLRDPGQSLNFHNVFTELYGLRPISLWK